jgi:hypothetical protein
VPIREVVSQISPPIRIVLVLAVAVLGVYMLFLRPKPEEIPPLEPAGTSTSQPGQIRDKAEEAVDAANSQLQQQESVDGVDAGESAAGTAPATKAGEKGNAAKGAAEGAPAQDLKGLPKPVRKAIRDNKVLVMLFSNGKSADDRAVAGAMKKVDRWDGRVFVHTAPLKRISRYGRIARGVNVEQSPTVVVAGRDLRAETLVGYTDRLTIDQAVVDALREERMFTSSYLRKVDDLCTEYGNKAAAMPHYWLANSSVPQYDRRLTRYHALSVEFDAKFAAIKAPKKYAAFRSASIADHKAGSADLAAFSAAVTPKSSKAEVRAAGMKMVKAHGPITKRYDARADALGLYRCGSQF